MANYFRGVSQEQDGRWSKADEKLLQKLSAEGKFAPILDKKVNLKKVNMDVINRWIAERITQLMGFEDDITFNTIINLLQNSDVDAKRMQISITAFLSHHAGKFMEDLWTLLSDAQSQPSGIPGIIIEKKREEILKRESAKASAANLTASAASSDADPTSSKGDEFDEKKIATSEIDDDHRHKDGRTDRSRGRSDRDYRRDRHDDDRGKRGDRSSRGRESRRSRTPERRRRAESTSSSSVDSEQKYRRRVRRRDDSSDRSQEGRDSRRRNRRRSGDRSRHRSRSDSRRRR